MNTLLPPTPPCPDLWQTFCRWLIQKMEQDAPLAPDSFATHYVKFCGAMLDFCPFCGARLYREYLDMGSWHQ